MFEYLMPLLLMRSYPDTLLDESCRWRCAGRSTTARERGVPWGISESAYNVVDRHGTYQYKAFGVPGLGLKRGLGDELVVAPYATALAAMIDPGAQRARTCAASPRSGCEGELRILRRRSTTRTRERDADDAAAARRTAAIVVRAYFAHHQGMTLVALANALLDDRMVERFHADPRVQATELLLQERVPRQRADHRAAAARRDARRRRRRRPCRCAASARRTRSFPHAQFLSNGNYVDGRHQRRRRRQLLRAACAVTRSRRDATRDPGSQFIYLRDVRSGAVWSADLSADAARAGRLPGRRSAPSKATFRRRDDEIVDAARHRGLHRRRRRSPPAARCVNQSDRAARDRRHQLRRDRARAAAPTTSRIRPSASCSSRPSTCRTARRCSAIGGRAIRASPARGRCTC